ncbi:hypothetical protein [Roseivirga pacifica]|uniref:hypothetical protein n=1 Tax=Roseivirga pacifica TaxID=1267423 RepID=UPI003BAA3082
MISFQEWLDENGFMNLSRDERRQAHRNYRTFYHAEYRKLKHRKIKRRVEIHFDTQDYKQLEKKAEKHQLTVPGFIRQTIRSYDEQTFIILEKEAIQAVELLLRQILGQLTQISFEAKRSHSVSLDELERLQKEVKTLKANVSKKLAFPPTAKEFLIKQQRENPEFLSRLMPLIQSLLKDNNDT